MGDEVVSRDPSHYGKCRRTTLCVLFTSLCRLCALVKWRWCRFDWSSMTEGNSAGSCTVSQGCCGSQNPRTPIELLQRCDGCVNICLYPRVSWHLLVWCPSGEGWVSGLIHPLVTRSRSSSSASGILSIFLALSMMTFQTLHPKAFSALAIDYFNRSLQLLAVVGIIQVSKASRKNGFPLLTRVVAITGSFGPSFQTSC